MADSGPRLETMQFQPNGRVPNSRFPVLLYRGAVTAGDVLVHPAGTSHTRLDNSDDSHMVGGYPEGRDWDLIRDEEVTEAEARAAVKLIGSLPIPALDPVTGEPMALWQH